MSNNTDAPSSLSKDHNDMGPPSPSPFAERSDDSNDEEVPSHRIPSPIQTDNEPLYGRALLPSQSRYERRLADDLDEGFIETIPIDDHPLAYVKDALEGTETTQSPDEKPFSSFEPQLQEEHVIVTDETDDDGGGGGDADMKIAEELFDANGVGYRPIEWRTIIFIRHGNSIWNQATDSTFRNPVRALGALGTGVRELTRLKWSEEYKHDESVILDTPLSDLGMEQANDLSQFLERHANSQEQRRLKFLNSHQKISTPIKDAIRILQDSYTSQENCSHSEAIDTALVSMSMALQQLQLVMLQAQRGYRDSDPVMSQKIILGEETETRRRTGTAMSRLSSRRTTQRDRFIGFDPNEALDSIATFDELLDGSDVMVVTSNLRRAISTCVIGLWPRFQRLPTDRVHILSCMQEVGINVDTMTALEENDVPSVSKFEQTCGNLDTDALEEFYRTRISVEHNYGSKSNLEWSEDVNKRVELFAKWVFSQQKSTIIAVGHSQWFKAFFRRFLPETNHSGLKRKKMANCAMVGCRLYFDPSVLEAASSDGTTPRDSAGVAKKLSCFGIAEKSVTMLYGSLDG